MMRIGKTDEALAFAKWLMQKCNNGEPHYWSFTTYLDGAYCVHCGLMVRRRNNREDELDIDDYRLWSEANDVPTR
jgi:hypothetical protein